MLTFRLQAVQEHSAIIAHVVSNDISSQDPSAAKLLEAALGQRAGIYEQLEAYELSLKDYCHVLQLHPGHPLVSKLKS